MFPFYDMKFYGLIHVNIDSRFQSCREFLAWPAILITIQHCEWKIQLPPTVDEKIVYVRVSMGL